jgi:hypothetical protein
MMQADNIKAIGAWYAENWSDPLLVDYFSIRPPLYAWLLIGLGAIWKNIYLVLLVQNVLSIINCWLVYRFVKNQPEISHAIEFLFIGGLLLYPAQLFHANFVMTEIVFQSFILFLFFECEAIHVAAQLEGGIAGNKFIVSNATYQAYSLIFPIYSFGNDGLGNMEVSTKWVIVNHSFITICNLSFYLFAK